MPFGYGPAAKLITLAENLRETWRLVFVGRGAALELASRDRDAFDEIVPIDSPRTVLDEALHAGSAVVSVMDRELASLARAAERPLCVVDSLLWMRPAVPEALAGAQLYLAQGFPGLAPGRYRPRPRVVGALVGPVRADPATRRQGLVVHLGGSAAPDDRRALYAAYARFAVDAVLRTRWVERFASVTVLGGAHVVAAIGGRLEGSGVGARSVSHAEARSRMADAAAVLTAPGLTATLECFAAKTPTWFLPPQNYSQWCILRRLRAAGAARPALHWEDLAGVPRLAEQASPRVYEPVVRETLLRLCADRAAAEALRSRLDRLGEAGDPVPAQSAFLRALGTNGVEAVSAALHELVGHVALRVAVSP